ncbi:MAG: ATP-dependent zinc metalloprotease FtsH [Desulfohalobiaceae bacterium]
MPQDNPSPSPFFGHRPQSDRKSPYGSLWQILLILLIVWWLSSLFFANGQGRRIDYSAFREQLKQDNVERVTVQGEQLQGRLRDPVTLSLEGNRTAEYQDFTTYLPSFGDDRLLTLLEDKDVAVTTEPEQDFSWVWILLTTLPFLLFFGLIYMQYRRMSGGKGGPGGIFSFGKSKARLFDRSTEQTTFDDVAGAEGAKEELKEIVAYLKNPEDIEKLGAEVPKGMLLVGPPGCGKTLLARAVAGESRVPFYSISGSDFMEMFVGVGASRVRDMFKAAKKDAPSIIFIDELDSIGRRRGAGLGGGHDEREQTLNQLLHELDGFEPNENVIVMSATNRPDILDQALLRPGRFDRRVVVDMPRSKDRLAILKLYAKNKPLAEDVDLKDLARNTPGFSGADLENLLNEAALLAARHQRDRILNEDIEEARDKVILGLQRQGLVMTDEERRFVAYHEAGHAVVAALLPHTDPVHKVSIIPRTRSMGVTQQFPEKEQYIYREEYMLDRLAVMMGGRASEELVFSTTTSGAGEDLKQATKLVRRMILEWGMGDRFRHMALGSEREEVFLGEQIAQGREYSDSTAREVDEVVQDILNRAFDRASKTLEEHRQGLDQLAETLLDQDEVAGEEVLEILGIPEQEAAQHDRGEKDEA